MRKGQLPMHTLSIDDLIRRDAKTFRNLDIPEPDHGRPEAWLRLPCPFCGRGGRRPPAVINYGIGWFGCHACGVRKSASYDLSAAARFGAVLRRAAWTAWRKFPGVLTLDEARSYAGERLSVYAGPDDGSCADAGALERWEKEADGEDQLDSYVLQALNCDLIDYARKLFRQQEREIPEAAGSSRPEDEWRTQWLAGLLDSKTFEDWEHMRDSGHFGQSDYPVLYMLHIEGYTRAEVEALLREKAGWTQQQFRERLDAEKRALAQAFYQDQHTSP